MQECRNAEVHEHSCIPALLHSCISISLLVHEPISQADDRFDLPTRDAEFAAQAADVHVHRARFDRPIVAPDPLEQPIAGHDAILVLDQVLKQLEFAACQPH